MSITSNRNGGSDLVLHHHSQSFYSQKVLMALYQKKLKFRSSIVDIRRGKQYNEKFLALNPVAEVPVLVDNEVRIIPGSDKIITYLDDNFSNGSPRLQPNDPDLKSRVNEMYEAIHDVRVEALSFGSLMFDDVGLNPKAPYNSPGFRAQLKAFSENRKAIIQTEMIKNPQYNESLSQKLENVRNNMLLFENRVAYEKLILTFEELMDQCEAELSTHEDKSWWLCSPDISIADISFSILLYRLWQLGFEKRMWERDRPYVARYFARAQQLESYKKAITAKTGIEISDIFRSPFFWCFVGFVAVGGGVYVYNKLQETHGGVMAALKGNVSRGVPNLSPFGSSPYGSGVSSQARDGLMYSSTTGSDGTRGISYSKGFSSTSKF